MDTNKDTIGLCSIVTERRKLAEFQERNARGIASQRDTSIHFSNLPEPDLTEPV
jgi:hypothetical protein